MADDNFAEVALAEKLDTRPICSAQTPAPKGRPASGAYSFGAHRWDWNWQHPDASEREINTDHGDIRCDCPHCGCYWIYEGPDA